MSQQYVLISRKTTSLWECKENSTATLWRRNHWVNSSTSKTQMMKISLVVTLQVSLAKYQTLNFTWIAMTSCHNTLLTSSAPNSGCREVYITIQLPHWSVRQPWNLFDNTTTISAQIMISGQQGLNLYYPIDQSGNLFECR
jgi:hypothetical protein